MFTIRFLIFALFFPVLLLLSDSLSFLTIPALAYGLGLVWLVWLDRRYAGNREQFRVERVHDQKLSLGARNLITIRIQSRSQRAVDVSLRDEAPLMFAGALDATADVTIPPREMVAVTYALRPLKRGDYAFGDINLHWNSPLGLYIRQAVIPARAPVKVYPNLHEIRKYDLLVRRDQLAEMGLHNTRLRGEGTEFESLRDYTPDDEYRSINWKATARRGKPISTLYEPERSQRVMIMLDAGRMMRSPVRVIEASGEVWDMAKLDFVLNSVLLFSYVATLKGDQVGLLIFSDRVTHYIAPGTGRSQFHKLLALMYALESEPVEADYTAGLTYLRAHNKKRSLVVMFTDLSGQRASAALVKQVPSLAPRHLPLVVTIRDPSLDQEARQRPASTEALYRRAVAENLIDERRLTLDTLGQHGVLTLDVAAEHLTMAVVNRYLRIKARMLI